MPPKAKIPAPIDRPLSRAYLREFSGWSTEYPPGLSEPTSLRIMENVMITREGAARIRPGLRYVSFSDVGAPLGRAVVGTHETFFLNDGRVAYLFAVREDDETVGFRVMVPATEGCLVYGLTDTDIDFTVPQGESVLRFTAETTYVSYLQIDNKIFALSNAGETMRLFEVGSVKRAHRLLTVTRPAWSLADKLTVLHPEGGWIDNVLSVNTRVNLARDPSFEGSAPMGAMTGRTYRSEAMSWEGEYGRSTALTPAPTSTNRILNPIRDAATYGWAGWTTGGSTLTGLAANATYLRGTSPAGTSGRGAHFASAKFPVTYGEPLWVSWEGAVSGANADFEMCRFVFYGAGGEVLSTEDRVVHVDSGRYHANRIIVPHGATSVSVRPRAIINRTSSATVDIRNVMVSSAQLHDTYVDGGMGSDYEWADVADASESYYYPQADVEASVMITPISADPNITASVYVRSGGSSRSARIGLRQMSADEEELDLTYSSNVTINSAGWTRLELTVPAEDGLSWAVVLVKVLNVPKDEVHYIDALLVEDDSVAGTFFHGNTAGTSTTQNSWLGEEYFAQSQQIVTIEPVDIPSAETRTAETLISSTASDNDYSFAFFYTISNQVGETAPSQVTVVRAQRPWSGWAWETPNADGEPSGTETDDPTACADQLVAYMPEAVFDQALLDRATAWSLYMTTWSDQDPVPVTAVKVAELALDASSEYNTHGWQRLTPQQVGTADTVVTLPNMNQRTNYSEPSRAGQGVIAADRMVLVMDPVNPALIRWSSNQQGEYTNFTASLGGGYKTLTSGNLYVPAAVKLWQNPQSVDTLTVMCMGTDGRSTSYYMAPAQVASQSEAVNVMGFEETTATPGTTSPFGCEVFNNALYHPLDDQLMKSTAMNYNINHKSQTDQIATTWSALANKHRINSAQLDGRLYYIVHNLAGAELEDGCQGNEVWVFDAKAESGNWSRWLVQGSALRTIERSGQIYMSITRPDGIFYFDPAHDQDDVVVDDELETAVISWTLETNTQGANRAHDAWAHLQQMNLVVGNFVGQMRYGIRSFDLHGQPVEVSKLLHAGTVADDEDDRNYGLTFDLEDYLLIRRDLREWFFFAESVADELSSGQISLVQYRYTPSTVNTGYEYGSVETFEYARAGVTDRTTESGVPHPMIDTRRP